MSYVVFLLLCKVLDTVCCLSLTVRHRVTCLQVAVQTTHGFGNTPEGPDLEVSRDFILPLGAATTVTPARQHLRRGYHRYPSVNNLWAR